MAASPPPSVVSEEVVREQDIPVAPGRPVSLRKPLTYSIVTGKTLFAIRHVLPTVVPSHEVVIEWFPKLPDCASFIFLTKIGTKYNGDMLPLEDRHWGGGILSYEHRSAL